MVLDISSVCSNCLIYGWESSGKPLLRCKKCKVTNYCGRDCQVEHWEKVHKEMCKYLSGTKKQVVGAHRHLASKCKECKDEKKGKEPYWECHMQEHCNFWNSPLLMLSGIDGEVHGVPFGVNIGELTGKYTSRLEHVIAVLQKILYKMNISGHLLSRKKQLENLIRNIFSLRHRFLSQASYTPSGDLVYYDQLGVLKETVYKDISPFRESRLIEQEKGDNLYRLWDTFVLISHYFLIASILKQDAKFLRDIGQIPEENMFLFH